MKLKVILFAAAIAVIGASVVVIVNQPRPHAKSSPVGDPLPTAISNYSKTFKLNTNPPIWPTSANGRNTNN